MSIPITRLGRRRGLKYRYAFVPDHLASWYQRSFGENGHVFEPLVEAHDPKLIQSTGGRSVYHIHCPGRDANATGWDVILKEERYRFPGWLYRLFSKPSCEREFHNFEKLAEHGVSTVKPVAYGKSGFVSSVRYAFLITEEFDSSVTLRSWLSDDDSKFSREEVRDLLMRFAPRLARLHRNGVYVGTLQPKNILLRRAANGTVEMALCDIPRLRSGRRFSFRQAVNDVATLAKRLHLRFTRIERLRLLLSYLKHLEGDLPARHWLSAIDRRLSRMNRETPAGRVSRSIRRFLRRRGLRHYWPF